MPRPHTLVTACVPLVVQLLAAPAAVTQERAFALASPTWTLTEPLSRVAGVGRLADGRLLIADSRERLLYVAGPDGRTLGPFGRNGEGPGEYQAPFAVTRMRAETLYVYAGNMRYLRITGGGQVAPDLSIPTSLLRGGGIAPPRGSDATGGLYWSGDVVGEENGQPKRREVQNIRRWDPATERLDTVAPLRDHARESHANRFHPFAERDAFVVARDGRVGVLSAREYRLRWYTDGRVVAEGPALTHEAIRIGAADRDAYRRERARQPAGGARISGPDPRAAEQPTPRAVRSMDAAFPDEFFPAVKPPFVENGVSLTPGEDLWVVRSGRLDETRTRIDVLRPDGVRRGHLLLPEGRRLVAVESEGIYLARVDDDGLEWLERYAWPEGLR